MIIECNNCKKKFDVDSSLIPETGRKIQCGSCEHIWFYMPDKPTLSEKFENEDNSQFEAKSQKKDERIKDYNNDEPKTILKKDSNKISFTKILSYIIVLIITFVAIIIVLETFKTPISNIFPNLELVLFNLFETLEDIFLFLKNLIF
tara:strand:+ start:102 stop:542 length:441 start_codon:yes stop_codon:yes gene_type:complete